MEQFCKSLKIGFDISQTGKNKAGCGYFSDAILKAAQKSLLNFEWHLFPHFGDFYYDGLISDKNSYSKGDYGPCLKTPQQASEFWNSPHLDKNIFNVDILHSNNFWCPTTLKKPRLVYTLYDLSFIKNHEWTTETNRMGCFDGVFKAAAYADGIISISEYSKKHFLETFPHYPEDRIEVIYPCSRFDANTFIKEKPSRLKMLSEQKFWLSVGTIEPRKNQKFLVEVYFEYLKTTNEPFPLVFAGKNGWMMDDFSAFIEKLGLKENVFILGYVDDAELVWLYKNCYANLYPSYFEGFGLPILEGMQLGALTIASNTSSMPEIVNDGFLLSPTDTEAWLKTMLKLQNNETLKKSTIEKAYKFISKFSWEKSAEKIGSYYQKIHHLPKITFHNKDYL